ncbi:MAG: hypothetical protein ACAI34_00405 [Verrucomicrobium sp.]
MREPPLSQEPLRARTIREVKCLYRKLNVLPDFRAVLGDGGNANDGLKSITTLLA